MDRKGTQMFLSLLRGTEAVSKFQAMNRRVLTEPKTMLGRPLSLQLCLYRQCISRTTTWRGTNKIPKCFSCPGDCKELSKKTKRSTYMYDSDQAMADPTADLRQQLADHEADKDKRDTKCFSNLDDCRGLSKEARRWNNSQLTVWQWLTRAHRV